MRRIAVLFAVMGMLSAATPAAAPAAVGDTTNGCAGIELPRLPLPLRHLC